MELVLNNGRKSYPMTLLEHSIGDDGTERCDYEIPDDDGKASPARFDIVVRHGRRVPQTVTIPARLRRQFRLVDVSVVAGGADSGPNACLMRDFAGAARGE